MKDLGKDWYLKFFDELYYEFYSSWQTEDINRSEAEFIIRALDLPKGSKLIDIGCGFARHAVYLAKFGYTVTCIDMSRVLVEKARERIDRFSCGTAIDLVLMDMRKLGFRQVFDGAYIFFSTFGFFSDEENELVLKEVNRILRPGGRLLLDLMNPIHLLTAFRNSITTAQVLMKKVWDRRGNYIVLKELRIDPSKFRLIAEEKYLRLPELRCVGSRTLSIRLYMLHEMYRLLDLHGFRIVKLYGDYDGCEYTALSPRLIIVAEKVS